MTTSNRLASYRLLRLVGAVAGLQEFCQDNAVKLNVNLEDIKQKFQTELTRLEQAKAEPARTTPLWKKL